MANSPVYWQQVLYCDKTNKVFVTASGSPLPQIVMTHGDDFWGYLLVVDQPGGTGTAFLYYAPTAAGSLIAITNGSDTVYARAMALTAVPIPAYTYLAYHFIVDGPALRDALAGVQSLSLFLEARICLAGTGAGLGGLPGGYQQKLVLSNDAMVLNNTALF